MALILGVQTGSRLYLNDVPVQVVKTHGYSLIVVEIDGQRFKITQDEATEVYPDVKMSAGIPTQRKTPHLPRLVIEAPRDIVILRSELYERNKASA